VPVPSYARIDVPTVLQAARSKVQADIDSSLQDYESVVRANAALPEVVTDLKKLASDNTHKTNATVHRVLGDALMRSGNLKDALETYRKALNLL
jgi:tetratricopeptide (TPR) repeat protein